MTRKIEKISKVKEEERTKEQKEMLVKLKGDLEYVMNFPKHRKYVSMFDDENEDEAQVKYKEERRARFRKEIKEILKARAELGDANEGNDINAGDDALLLSSKMMDDDDKKKNDLDGDDFFLNSSSASSSDDDDDDDDKKEKTKKKNRKGSSSSSSSSSDSDSDSSLSDSDKQQQRDKKKKKEHAVVKEMQVTREPVYIPLPKAKRPKTDDTNKRPADAPLRSRAEGGRKRRKK